MRWCCRALNTIVDEEVLLAKAKEMAIEVSDVDVTTYTDAQVKEIRRRSSVRSRIP